MPEFANWFNEDGTVSPIVESDMSAEEFMNGLGITVEHVGDDLVFSRITGPAPVTTEDTK